MRSFILDYFPNFELVPISREILLEAAALRARTQLRTRCNRSWIAGFRSLISLGN